MPKLLIVGDPVGSHSQTAIENGVNPENITVWENNPRFSFAVECIDGRIDIMLDDTYLTKLSECSMDFDYCIGNPPYSDRSNGVEGGCIQLDNRFLDRCMELADSGSLIIRSKHFMNPKSKFRRDLFASKRLTSIVRCSDDTFPSILNTETCIVSWSLSHNEPCAVTFADGTVNNIILNEETLIKLTNSDFKYSVDNNLAHRWVRGKLSRRNIIEGTQPMVEVLGKGNNPVIVNIQPGQEMRGCNTYGVMMNHAAQWGALGKIMIKPYSASVSGSIILLTTDSEDEAIRLKAYLETDEVKQLVKDNMPSFHPNKDLFSKIVDPL